MNVRARLLPAIHRFVPLNLQGDLKDFAPRRNGFLSCIINFFGRLDRLAGILHCLADQDLDRQRFEVILVEDRGGTPEGKAFCLGFRDRLPVRYFALDKNYGCMGYSRNFGLGKAAGEYILFLDDDTLLPDPGFLSGLLDLFQRHPDVDAVIPRGLASFSLLEGRYAHHDPFFMTSRCMAYRRKTLEELGGFVDQIIGQEDVEFVVRFLASGKKALRAPGICYRHPPLLVENTQKAQAVGYSFARLRHRYPLAVWLLLLANGGRHLPLFLSPAPHHRHQGRFAAGFLGGVLSALARRQPPGYQG